MTTTHTTITVGFEHTAGGDSKLPANDRGFFDFYTVDVSSEEAATHLTSHPACACSETADGRLYDAAQAVAEEVMRKMVRDDHPDWMNGAIDDLVAVAANHPERN
jgi:hypothetical protein